MTWKRNTKPANAARRGKRINNPGPLWPEVQRTLNWLPPGKTIAELARKLKTYRKTVWKWKTGKHWPTAATVRRIKNYLETKTRP